LNADDIDRILPGKDGKGSRLRLRGDEVAGFDAWETADELAASINAQHVHAHPGFLLVSGDVSDGCTYEMFERWQVPIVAWRISPSEVEPTPITVDGPWDGVSNSANCLIIQPNGIVCNVGNRSWPSLREAYDELTGEYRARAAAAAARAEAGDKVGL
jgi:hypothetical protein